MVHTGGSIIRAYNTAGLPGRERGRKGGYGFLPSTGNWYALIPAHIMDVLSEQGGEVNQGKVYAAGSLARLDWHSFQVPRCGADNCWSSRPIGGRNLRTCLWYAVLPDVLLPFSGPYCSQPKSGKLCISRSPEAIFTDLPSRLTPLRVKSIMQTKFSLHTMFWIFAGAHYRCF